MTKKICVTFYLKSDKKKTDGSAPIYARITCTGDRTSFSTGKYISPARWSTSKQLKLARKEEDQILKVDIDQIKKELGLAKERLIANKQTITAENIKKEYLLPQAVSQLTSYTLLDVFLVHNKKFWDKVALGKRSEESFKKHHCVQDHIILFLEQKYGVYDYPINKLDLDFIDSFEQYLRNTGEICNNTALKYCQFFASMINTARRKKWIEKNPFSEFEYDFDEVETHYLTDEELKRIEQTPLPSERLNIVRDIFLFTCYTSYAPTDVRKLTHNHIKHHIAGQKWIYTTRSKTKIESNVPILPPVFALIEKYKHHQDCIVGNKLMPLRSSSKMNDYLKELGTLCKIPFKLHHYVARHTFATMMISKGVSMESVSKMMGHRRILQTQHYAKIVENKVGLEMQKISDLFFNVNIPSLSAVAV